MADEVGGLGLPILVKPIAPLLSGDNMGTRKTGTKYALMHVSQWAEKTSRNDRVKSVVRALVAI